MLIVGTYDTNELYYGFVEPFKRDENVSINQLSWMIDNTDSCALI